MIFDEPTSAPDSATEQTIQAVRVRIAEGRTTLVFAHCLSRMQDAGRILLRDGGHVV